MHSDGEDYYEIYRFLYHLPSEHLLEHGRGTWHYRRRLIAIWVANPVLCAICSQLCHHLCHANIYAHSYGWRTRSSVPANIYANDYAHS